MAFSNIVMFAIIVATAVSLGSHGKHNIASAAEAASALRPIAGEFASALFALGFIGAGMLAIKIANLFEAIFDMLDRHSMILGAQSLRAASAGKDHQELRLELAKRPR